jgi:hypothetical protein
LCHLSCSKKRTPHGWRGQLWGGSRRRFSDIYFSAAAFAPTFSASQVVI